MHPNWFWIWLRIQISSVSSFAKLSKKPTTLTMGNKLFRFHFYLGKLSNPSVNCQMSIPCHVTQAKRERERWRKEKSCAIGFCYITSQPSVSKVNHNCGIFHPSHKKHFRTFKIPIQFAIIRFYICNSHFTKRELA